MWRVRRAEAIAAARAPRAGDARGMLRAPMAFDRVASLRSFIARKPDDPFPRYGLAMELKSRGDLAASATAFDELIASWHLGVTKPDPAAFDLAAERIGATPTEIVFVDDAEANVAGARAAGWNAIAFTTALDLHAALASLRTP